MSRHVFIGFEEVPGYLAQSAASRVSRDISLRLRVLNAGGVDSQLHMWYLHGPDRTVPYEVTLKAVNDLYKEGKFKRFGISNYMSYVPVAFCAVQFLICCQVGGRANLRDLQGQRVHPAHSLPRNLQRRTQVRCTAARMPLVTYSVVVGRSSRSCSLA